MILRSMIEHLVSKNIAESQPPLTNYHPKIEDPLVTAGVLLQFSASFVPVVGGLLSQMVDLLWPQAQSDSAWDRVKLQVENLIDEEIDNEQWQQLVRLTDEFRDKITIFSAALNKKHYSYAKDLYTSLTGYFIGVENRFMIQGKKLSYAFTPLYCLTIAMVSAFRLEVINHGEKLNLASDEIESEKENINHLLQDGIAWLKKAESEHKSLIELKLAASLAAGSLNDGMVKNINSLFNKDYYYKTRAFVFIQLWTNQLTPASPAKPVQLAFPAFCAGIFYKQGVAQAVAMNGSELAQLVTPLSEQESITALTLYESIESSPEYLRPTGIRVTTNSGTSTSGYTGAAGDLQVSAHSLNCGTEPENALQSVSAQEFKMINQLTIGTASGAKVAVGHNSGSAASLTLSGPYRIARIYLPDDSVAYTYEESGHQMAGIACGAVYDNTLAAACAQNYVAQSRALSLAASGE